MEIDWTPLIREYPGQWVALKNDEKTVVGARPKLSQLLQEIDSNIVRQLILTKLPEETLNIAGISVQV